MSISPEGNVPEPSQKQNKLPAWLIIVIAIAVILLIVFCCLVIGIVVAAFFVPMDQWYIQYSSLLFAVM